jgi:cell division transport system permease protein
MRLRLLVAEAWRSLASNVSTTFAATMTVLVGMFILGLFIALFTWTQSWSNHVKRELVVKVDFKTSGEKGGPATRQQENAVARLLSSNPKIKTANFIPKAVAFRQMQKLHPELTRDLPWNPLPDSFQVVPVKAEYIHDIAQSLQPPPPGVSKVIEGKKLSSRVLTFAHVIDIVFAIGAVVLVLASTLLIANTIRLSIFSRRREIEVMKLVGATNWFVRAPFMIEGLICGFAGSLLAILLLILAKAVALPAIHYHGFADAPDVHAWAFPLTALILLGMGIGLGAFGSGLTLRRFLKV